MSCCCTTPLVLGAPELELEVGQPPVQLKLGAPVVTLEMCVVQGSGPEQTTGVGQLDFSDPNQSEWIPQV